MSDAETCPQCGASLPPDAPAGICPTCALGLALENDNVWSEPAATEARAGSFRPPAVAELAEHFPQLEIIEPVGHGGMGAVYKARQPGLDRLVALKILSSEIGADPAFAERFTREARTLAKLSHPNIVTLYDSGETGGLYFLVMEFVDGVNLREAIQAQKMSPKEALAVVPQICDALQYAHDEGVVHRDIKPENVLLDKKGRVKVADFGLAKLLRQTPADKTLTQTHQVLGTLHYMAPEQIESPTAVDHRADLYSLGVVFYELLTGKLPLGRFPLPSEEAKIDAKLDDVVLRTLEREPERRYQQASLIKTDVESVASHAPVKVAVAAAAATPPVTSSSDVDIELVERQVRGPATALIWLGLLNMAPLFLFVFLVVRREVRIMSYPGNSLVDSTMEALITHAPLLPSVPFGLVMLLGGLSLRRLGSYELARIAAVVGFIPFSPLFVLNLWGAIWLWQILSRSDVKAAFQAKLERDRTGRPDVSRPVREWPNPGLLMMAATMGLIGAIFAVGHPTGLEGKGLLIGIGLMLGGGGCLAGAFGEKGKVPLNAVHPGPLAMGLVMAATGGFLFAGALLVPRYMDDLFIWVGMGIAIGGGGCFCGVWDKRHLAQTRVFNPSALVLGIAMIAIGIVVLAMGFNGHNDMLVFLGVGLILGGGGCCAGAWQKKEGEQAAAGALRPENAARRRDSVSNDFWAARKRRQRSAVFLLMLGFLAILWPIVFIVIGLVTDPLPLDLGYYMFLPLVPVGALLVFVAARMWKASASSAGFADVEYPPGKELPTKKKSLLLPLVLVSAVAVLLAGFPVVKYFSSRVDHVLEYRVAWHFDVEESERDEQELIEILNRRLETAGVFSQPLGAVRLNEELDSTGSHQIEVDVFGHSSTQIERVRRRVEADGSFKLGVLAHRDHDQRVIGAAMRWGSSIEVNGDVRARWITCHDSLWELIKEFRIGDREMVTRGSHLLVLETDVEINQSHIKVAQDADEEGFAVSLTEEGASLWREFQAKHLPGDELGARRLCVVLDGEVHHARALVQTGETEIVAGDNVDLRVGSNLSIDAQRDWLAILEAGTLPATLIHLAPEKEPPRHSSPRR